METLENNRHTIWVLSLFLSLSLSFSCTRWQAAATPFGNASAMFVCELSPLPSPHPMPTLPACLPLAHSRSLSS